MSDLMFDESPVVGTKYKPGDWKLYSIHSDNEIRGFFGDYMWLSNFYICDVYYEGLIFPSSENAYQAAKVKNKVDRMNFINSEFFGIKCSPYQSKKIWNKYELLDESPEKWDLRKYDVMSVILFDKFLKNKDLRQKLLDTSDKILEETNHWHDNFWGRCICDNCQNIDSSQQNHLGKILTKIRNYWKS